MMRGTENYTGLEIAVIGMSGRFPGADNIAQLWEVLVDGKETISFFDREQLERQGVDKRLLDQAAYIGARGIVNNAEGFDAAFFGFSAREAELLDPQVRIFFECVYEALEDAGYDPFEYTRKIGLFAGANPNLYWSFGSYLAGKEDMGDFANKDLLTTRISYKLNLKGPSHTLFTACSTSLVSIHMACRSLLGGECDMALAGGVSIDLPQVNGYMHKEGMILSADGHNRSFDKDASGTVFGNGAGVVLLKTLEDALRDGDQIYAVIKGTAVNNDGNRKVSFPAPSVAGQAEVIREAIQIAQVEAGSISYVEAHGSATALGDPIEVEALGQVLNSAEKASCGIGSIKSNVGHLNIASGVAGFIKTTLALKNRIIPPSIHFNEANPKIDFEKGPLYVVSKLTPWKPNGELRRAGVSSFGVGGTNAHAILEEAPTRKRAKQKRRPALLLWSAKTSSSLTDYSGKLSWFLHANEVNIEDAAYTLQVGRHAYANRSFAVFEEYRDPKHFFSEFHKHIKCDKVDENVDPKPIFMFSGQGSQYIHMGRDLYNCIETFRLDIDRGLKEIDIFFKCSSRNILYPEIGQEHAAEQLINNTQFTQPILFVFEYALSNLLQRMGIKPHAMIGHSLGEYVAACVSGVLTFEDALKLVLIRGKLMADLEAGSMLAISIQEEELMKILPEDLSIAAVNSINSCVVSGTTESVHSFQGYLESAGYSMRLIRTSHAFHSGMMEPILKQFEQEVQKVKFNEPQIPYISNLTGTWVKYQEICKPSYWVDHLRNTVKFKLGIQNTSGIENSIFIELGPGNVLTTFTNQILKSGASINMIRHFQEKTSDEFHFLNKLGMLWLKGTSIKWETYHNSSDRHRISLPTYSFDRKAYWFNEVTLKKKISLLNQTAKPEAVEKNIYKSMWSHQPLQLGNIGFVKKQTRCILFIGKDGVGQSLKVALRDHYELPIIIVRQGELFTKVNEYEYELNPFSKICIEDFLKAIHSKATTSLDIVFCSFFIEKEEQRFFTLPNFFLSRIKKYEGAYRNIVECIAGNKTYKNVHVVSMSRKNLGHGEGRGYDCSVSFFNQANTKIRERFSGIVFKRIEIDIPDRLLSESIYTKGVKQLVGELFKIEDGAVLLRGTSRSVLTIRPFLDTDLVSDQNPSGRTLMIAGASRPNEFEVIGSIAERDAAINVLIEREHLNPEKWDVWEKGKTSISDLVSANVIVDHQKPVSLKEVVAQMVSLEKVRNQEVAFIDIAEQLGVVLICEFLERCGIDVTGGNSFSRQDLYKQVRVIKKYDKFFNYLLEVLSEAGILEIKEDTLHVIKQVDTQAEVKRIQSKIAALYPQSLSLFNLSKHCTDNLKQVLSGEIAGVGVLFPEGSTRLLDSLATDNSEMSAVAGLSIEVRKLVLEYAKEIGQKREVRILEVGAGRGELTKFLLPALKELNVSVKYYFTDIGNTFLREAKKRFGSEYAFVEFKQLDITSATEQQGFESYSMDIVLALDVIHATSSLEQTLRNLSALMLPGGWLLAMENTSNIILTNLVWGLTDGWWEFSDSHLRKLTPLITGKEWTEFLDKMPFEYAKVLPENGYEHVDHSLIMLQTKAGFTSNEFLARIRATKKREIEEIQNAISSLRKLKEKYTNVSLVYPDHQSDWNKAIKDLNKPDGDTIDSIILFLDHTETHASRDGETVRRIMEVAAYAREYNVEQCSVITPLETKDGRKVEIGEVHISPFDFLIKELNSTTSSQWINIKYVQSNDARDLETRRLNSLLGDFMSSILAGISNGECKWIVTNEVEKTIDDNFEVKDVAPEVIPECDTEVSADTVEHKLCAIWKDIFGVDKIRPSDNYFELGGDSLIMVELLAKITSAFKVKLKISEFYDHVTVRSLAALIATRQKVGELLVPRAEMREFYPTTSAQTTMFYLQLLHTESTAYNITKVIELHPEVDMERVCACFNRIVERQDNLRTIFKIVNGVPSQIIKNRGELRAKYIEAKQQNLRQVVENFIEPFNLLEIPPMRLGFIICEEARYMVLDIHHIICDGIAIDVLKKELNDLYFGNSLPTIPLQYKDFAYWKTKRAFKAQLEKHEEFWLETFKVPVAPSTIPPDFERNIYEAHQGAHLIEVLDKEVTARMYELTKRANATLFTQLLSVAYVLLAKQNNSADVVIGTGTAGRNFKNLEFIVGNFVNTVAIRSFPKAEKSYSEFLNEVRNAVSAALEHDDYQYEELINRLPYNQGKKDKSLFNVAVTLSSESLVEQKENVDRSLFKQYVDLFDNTSKFDIGINAVEKDGTITLVIEYAASLYKAETITNFLKQYIQILEMVTANTTTKLSAIPYSASDKVIERNTQGVIA